MLAETEAGFRITLNLPASETVVGHQPAVEFQRRGGTVRLRAASEGYPVASRGERGGLGVLISGRRAKELLEALQAAGATPAAPYFSLSETSDGWYALNHEQVAPARHIPQIRVWLRGVVAVPDVPTDEPMWAQDVRRAFAVVEEYERSGVGRPSIAVMQAREVVRVFRALVMDLLPVAHRRPAEAALASAEEAVRALREALGEDQAT